MVERITARVPLSDGNNVFTKDAIIDMQKQIKNKPLPLFKVVSRNLKDIIGVVDEIKEDDGGYFFIGGIIRNYHWSWKNGKWVKVIDNFNLMDVSIKGD